MEFTIQKFNSIVNRKSILLMVKRPFCFHYQRNAANLGWGYYSIFWYIWIENMMHQKRALSSFFLVATKFQILRQLLWILQIISENMHDSLNIRLCTLFSFKFNVGFHISDDSIISKLNLSLSKISWKLQFKNWNWIKNGSPFYNG